MKALLIGVKRLLFRANDARSAAADAEYRAKRPGVISAARGVCVWCGYASLTRSEVHHADDNHHNNNDDNLLVSCPLCHAYQHIGEPSKAGGVSGEGLGAQTLLVAIPELSAKDLNHLQRALGVAMNDPKEGDLAREIAHYLAQRSYPVREVWGTASPANFAAALFQLTSAEYANREGAVGHLRVLFHDNYLTAVGHQVAADHPALASFNTWESVIRDVYRKSGTPF